MATFCHRERVTPVAAGFLSAALTFVVAELVCRLLLHLADDIVPLVVFPLMGLVGLSVGAYLGRRGSSGG